jgi:predicted nucleotidyltransferase
MTVTQRETIRRVTERHRVRRVRLFGSHAKQSQTLVSDLDLLVDLGPERTLLDIVALKQDLDEALQMQVDVVTEQALSPYIRDQVLREAIDL